MQSLLKAAKTNIIHIIFTDLNNGLIREMRATLDPIYCRSIVPEQNEKSDELVFWSLDRQDWRSINQSSIINWTILK